MVGFLYDQFKDKWENYGKQIHRVWALLEVIMIISLCSTSLVAKLLPSYNPAPWQVEWVTSIGPRCFIANRTWIAQGSVGLVLDHNNAGNKRGGDLHACIEAERAGKQSQRPAALIGQDNLVEKHARQQKWRRNIKRQHQVETPVAQHV